jgi:hypothetical protein
MEFIIVLWRSSLIFFGFSDDVAKVKWVWKKGLYSKTRKWILTKKKRISYNTTKTTLYINRIIEEKIKKYIKKSKKSTKN